MSSYFLKTQRMYRQQVLDVVHMYVQQVLRRALNMHLLVNFCINLKCMVAKLSCDQISEQDLEKATIYSIMTL